MQFQPCNNSCLIKKVDNETLRALCRKILETGEETVEEYHFGGSNKYYLANRACILDLLSRLHERYSKQDARTLVALL